ncbi:hypothetical protein [Sphingopyxis sp. GW247-27LB]|uniref:hypothetical protein n=1 Tax=Sphingopyxis sp. GW247-27LB TaxID=2012632 RepID=UPI0011410751|nr:hypothetical protein [Sphingopyxis sp. GW247-27LB]
MNSCPIWGTPAQRIAGYEGRDGIAVDSPRAGGKFFISHSAKMNLQNSDDSLRAKVSFEIVRHNYISSIPEISTGTIEALASTQLKVTDRSVWLLRFLVKRSKHLGEILDHFSVVDTQSNDTFFYIGRKLGPGAAELFAWSGSVETDEVIFLLDILQERGAVRLADDQPIPKITVMAKGYDEVSPAGSNGEHEQAFVAMWFDNSMLEPYELGIETAVRSAGYRPMRIDRKEHVNKIDDEIIAEIRRSRFLVADFTSQPASPRGGVYFEAGFALALGKPVIWTCREDLIEHVHFDTRQFNHIVWADPAQLRDRLLNRILAVLGQGPLN